MSIERDAAWSNKSPQLPTATSQPLRTAFQPPNELCGLSATNRNREPPGVDRAMEGRSAEGDDVYNIARRNSINLRVGDGSGTTFSFELFAGLASQRRGGGRRRSFKPTFARSRA
ncbi:MAG: hypothetical protein DME96_09125 [Verrucomicrobia bacterium]|nr:MAG: hypothetical protein DME96_09125 [Verrucomicrobiota bacterium]